MRREELIFYAKYPFVSKDDDIKSFIKNINVFSDSQIINSAYQLVFTGITRKDYENKRLTDIKMEPFTALSDDDIKKKLLIYPISRMLLSLLDNPYYTSRFSSYYAKRCMKYFRSDERDEKLIRYVSRLLDDLNLDFIKAKIGYKIHYTQYVSIAPNISKYSLSNKQLYGGYVYITENERYFLIEQAIHKRVAMLPRNVSLPDNIIRLSEKLQKEIESNLPKPADANVKYSIPPCIKRLIDDLKAHKKLSHIERWALAVYLNKKKMSKDSIIRLFSLAPNFDINITEYQLDYLIKRNYGMPSCKSMKTYGLCVAECGISSPLKYRKKASMIDKNKKSKNKKQKT
ncbi:hypothetical protein J7J26_01450 [Candidatus Micrarchaeota archaeon]|nr:hypothetical protein [Candidatus Micrarchaeota archaeon]